MTWQTPLLKSPRRSTVARVVDNTALVCMTVGTGGEKWSQVQPSHPALDEPQGFSWRTLTDRQTDRQTSVPHPGCSSIGHLVHIFSQHQLPHASTLSPICQHIDYARWKPRLSTHLRKQQCWKWCGRGRAHNHCVACCQGNSQPLHHREQWARERGQNSNHSCTE